MDKEEVIHVIMRYRGGGQQRLMGIVHQNGVRIGRTLEEKEVGAENSKCNADFGIMQEAEGWIRKRY